MGADAKRKDARKCRFGNQTAQNDDGPTIPSSEGVGTEEFAKKKAKRVSQTLPYTRRDPAIEGNEAGDYAVAIIPAEQRDRQTTTTQRAQRFIVFIGMFSPCLRRSKPWHLTEVFSYFREFAIYSYG
jgi:hypothetical protein